MYEQLLGLESPWRVQDVDLQLALGQVVIHVEADSQTWACPLCQTRMHVHDYSEREWRHLDTCQFKTIIRARVPRVQCKEHGTTTVQVPWAEKYSRFTAFFERLAIDMLHDCSISATAKYLRLSWNEVDHIKAKAVERGLTRSGGPRKRSQ